MENVYESYFRFETQKNLDHWFVAWRAHCNDSLILCEFRVSRDGGDEVYYYVRCDDLYFAGTNFWMNFLSQNSGYHEGKLKRLLNTWMLFKERSSGSLQRVV